MTNTTGAIETTLQGEQLLLLPQKAIYWKNQQTLIAADVHLGKVGHFRKAGIAVPRDLEQNDLAVLSDLIDEHRPKHILFLGDLFHSDMNADWEWFALWRRHNKNIRITLIKGNHDIIHDKHYQELDVELYKELIVGPFLMLHAPISGEKLDKAEGYVLCGHIHPGVLLTGRARQSVTIPCFTFGSRQGILPSFGRFTGRVALKHAPDERIFGVLKDKVLAL